MIKRLIVLLFISICIFSCATIQFTEKNIYIVMARCASKGEGPSGISDKFSLDGRAIAYITFKWEDLNQYGGIHMIESKWYSGDKLVQVKKMNVTMGNPPHYVWFDITNTALGIGKARVEIYSDGVFIGKKDFEIVDKLEK